MDSLRKSYNITYAKAIAIILMVVLHSGSLGYFDTVVAMFHMPLFFFMSGYCFKDKYLSMPFVFLKKRLYGLYYHL